MASPCALLTLSCPVLCLGPALLHAERAQAGKRPALLPAVQWQSASGNRQAIAAPAPSPPPPLPRATDAAPLRPPPAATPPRPRPAALSLLADGGESTREASGTTRTLMSADFGGSRPCLPFQIFFFFFFFSSWEFMQDLHGRSLFAESNEAKTGGLDAKRTCFSPKAPEWGRGIAGVQHFSD